MRTPGGRTQDDLGLSRTMDCERAIRQVYAYLDGELTLWKRRAIMRHLDQCSPCSHGYSFEVELRQVIVSKCHEEVPVDLRDRIAKQLGVDQG